HLINSADVAIKQAFVADPMYVNLVAEGNGGDHVQLAGGSYFAPKTWDFGGLPVHLTGDVFLNDFSAVLTITPGTIVKFPNGSGILSTASAANRGALMADGTPSEPIFFTSIFDDSVGGDSNGDGDATEPMSDLWRGIWLYNASSSLSNVDIRYGGSANFGSLYLENLTVPDVGDEFTLTHVSIASSGDYAIEIAGGSPLIDGLLSSDPEVGHIFVYGSGSPVITNSDFLGGDIGIRINNGQSAIATNSSFVGQSQFGVQHLGSDRANATFTGNYWADAGGPHDPSGADGFQNDNPAGTPVTDFVNYGSFLTSAPRSIGPKVLSAELDLAQAHIRIEFDRPLDASSFGVNEFTLTGPSSSTIDSVALIGGQTVIVTLSEPLNAGGNHTLTVDSTILGIGGVAMDQDGDGSPGEAVDDSFSTVFNVDRTGPRVIAQSPSGTTDSVLQFIDLTFDAPIDPNTLSVDDVLLLSPSDITAFDDFDSFNPTPGFAAKAIKAIGTFSNLSGALQVLGDPSLHSEVIESTVGTINYGTSDGEFTPNVPPPAFVDGTDYFVIEALATITIPSAGQWTFAAASDDGYRLEVGDNVAERTTGRPIATDLHVFDFPAAGDYPLRMVMFEQNQGEGFELSTAIGNQSSFDPGLFTLVGDTGGLEVETRLKSPVPTFQTLGVRPLDGTDTTFRVFFDPVVQDDDYTLLVGPDVHDLRGNTMDQNQNGVQGEPVDRYESVITIERDPLRVVSQTPNGALFGALESLFIEFNVPIDEGSFSSADVRINGPVGVVDVIGIARVNDTTYRIDVPRSTADGDYEIFIGPGITDLAGSRMDGDGDAIEGEISDRFESTIALTGAGPQVQAFDPLGTITGTLEFVDVKFSEPLLLSSLISGTTINGPDGEISVTSVTLLDPTTYRLNFDPQTTGGQYEFILGPNITDLAGTSMDQDGDEISGEADDDTFRRTLRIDAGGPRVIQVEPNQPIEPFDAIDFTFDEQIDVSTLTLSDLQLSGPNGAINLSQIVGRGSNVFRVRFPLQSDAGDYTLLIGPEISDPVGNLMNQDGDTIFGEPAADRLTEIITLESPDLTIDEITSPDVVENGESITVSWMGLNDGSAIDQSWTDQVVISLDAFYGNADDVLLGEVSISENLQRGEAYSASLDATIPFGISGDATLFVISDSNNDIFEFDDANNPVGKPTTINFVSSPVDLVVEAI
ncbi:MAG: CARDB domain-containing protein, partial [Planctomycetota bacterium]